MPVDSSILRSTKKLINVPSDYEVFDLDIITYINSVFVTLSDLGIGPAKVFSIDDDSTKWEDFLPDCDYISMVKTYMALSVRMLFDPPRETWTIQAMKDQIAELGWRINVRRETTDYFYEAPRVDVALPVAKRVVTTPDDC